MGGRGASFLKQIGKGIENNNVGSIEPFLNDMPIPDDKMTDIMIDLKKENIIIYNSMLKLPQDLLNEQLESLRHLTNNNKKLFLLIDKNKPLQIRLAKFTNKKVQACFSMLRNFENPRIYYNANFANKTLKQVEEHTKAQQDSGWWTRCDEKNLSRQVTTHEFGHFVNYNLIKKLIDRRCPKKYKELEIAYNNGDISKITEITNLQMRMAYSINNQIALISKKIYGTMRLEDISEYGKTSQMETFAELYTNAMLSSKPNDMSKALKKYIKEKLK
jgi:hypothetical protein